MMSKHFVTFFVALSLFTFIDAIDYAYMSPGPGQISMRVGGTINITCWLSEESIKHGYDNSILSFWNDKQREITENIDRPNNSSIQLIIKNAPPKEFTYLCKFNRTMGIEQVTYNVGYPPKPVRNFKCVSKNRDNINCTFSPEHNPVASKYELRFAVGTERDPSYILYNMPCELQIDYYGGYSCYKGHGNGYRQSYEYYFFQLNATNELGNHIDYFTINHYDSIQLNPVVDLTTRDIQSDSALLTWTLPTSGWNLDRAFVFLITYTCDASNEIWTNRTYDTSRNFAMGSKNFSFKLENLEYAFTGYDVRVYVKVAKDDVEDDPLWSNYSAHIFKTASRRPDNPPETDIGSFSISDNKQVYVFWKALPEFKQNGANFKYEVIEPNHMKNLTPLNTGRDQLIFARFEPSKALADTESELNFKIHSVNDVGKSEKFSSVHVPGREARLARPNNIRKIVDEQNYVLSWALSADRKITSYTVFWCTSRNMPYNQCDGSIDFRRLERNVNRYNITSNQPLNMAVSANSINSSSGMEWARCTGVANSDLNKITDFYPTNLHATSITFRWSLDCVDDALIKEYLLSICPIKGNGSECSGTKMEIRINSTNIKIYQVANLKPYTTYKAEIKMTSTDGKAGPPSDAVFTTTLEAAPSPPRELRYEALNSTSVTLSWTVPEIPNGVLKKYLVYFNNREETVNHPSDNKTILVVNYTRIGLDSFTEYDVLVKACTQNCSNSSNPIRFRTKIGQPSQLDPPKFENQGIEWNAPIKMAGPIHFYEMRATIQAQSGKSPIVKIVRVSGQKCTFVKKMCESASITMLDLSVRAVNVIHSVHANDSIIEKFVNRHALVKRQAASKYIQNSSDDNRIDDHHRRHHHISTDDSSFDNICYEQHDDLLERFLEADRHAEYLNGNWSASTQRQCIVTVTHGGLYFYLIFVIIFLMAALYGSLFAMKKFQRMKDIAVELPAGLEDIKIETKGKNLDRGIDPQDVIGREVDTTYATEYKTLLQSCMESMSSNSTQNSSQCGKYKEMVDNSENDQTTENDSIHSMSEGIDTFSPTPLIPLSKPPVQKRDFDYVEYVLTPAGSTTNIAMPTKTAPIILNKPLTSNGYVTHAAIIGKPMGTTDYLPWIALDAKPQTDSITTNTDADEHKTKTPIVASTDIQGISGYVTHKQLSDFGQLMH